jgi:hypothetical protein
MCSPETVRSCVDKASLTWLSAVAAGIVLASPGWARAEQLIVCHGDPIKIGYVTVQPLYDGGCGPLQPILDYTNAVRIEKLKARHELCFGMRVPLGYIATTGIISPMICPLPDFYRGVSNAFVIERLADEHTLCWEESIPAGYVVTQVSSLTHDKCPMLPLSYHNAYVASKPADGMFVCPGPIPIGYTAQPILQLCGLTGQNMSILDLVDKKAYDAAYPDYSKVLNGTGLLIDPKSTYLHTVNDSPLPPTPVSLKSLKLKAGDRVTLTVTVMVSYCQGCAAFPHGSVFGAFTADGSQPNSDTAIPTQWSMWTTSPVPVTYQQIATLTTYYGNESTDILNDFAVPDGASDLWLTFNDRYFGDNSGYVNVAIKLEKK